MKDYQTLLLELSAQYGISGREQGVRDYLTRALAPYGPCTVNPLGSLICTLRPRQAGRPNLLLCAHMDEVGFVVTHISEEGFLRVAAVGGLDPKLFAGTAVEIHLADGLLPGLVCSTPPHLQKGGDTGVPKAEDIHLDVGLGGEEAKGRIPLGSPVTLLSHPKVLLDGAVSGKALDDRACCAALLGLAELLGEETLDCGVTLLFSTMEETGSQGARTAAYTVDPTHAIALDVSFGHSPDAKKHLCGEMGKGPMVGIAPILDDGITQALFALGKAGGIPCQTEVMAGSTGTDADCIATTRGGVATGLVSIPLRYMHSPVECIAPADVEGTAKLLAAWVREMAASPSL